MSARWNELYRGYSSSNGRTHPMLAPNLMDCDAAIGFFQYPNNLLSVSRDFFI